jgi:hypothetical protein
MTLFAKECGKYAGENNQNTITGSNPACTDNFITTKNIKKTKLIYPWNK